LRKHVIVALVAIALLGMASFVAIYLTSAGAPAPDASSMAGGAPPPPAGLGAVPIAAPPAPGSAAPEVVAPHQQQALLPPPAQDSWDAAPLILRGRTFGRLGMSLESAVSELRPAVDPCLNEDTQARYGTKGFTAYDGRPAADQPQVATLMLEIETMAGGARIVDAPVEERGTASDGLLSCAQSALRGKTLAVPEATPGNRYRMRFPVRL
jgi:hypothetical protein